MINRDDIEVGDKCYTRDGGCLVARVAGNSIMLGSTCSLQWNANGNYSNYEPHPLDIIRIEKAPKPLVRYLGFHKSNCAMHGEPGFADEWPNVMKLTFINGKLDKAEQVK